MIKNEMDIYSPDSCQQFLDRCREVIGKGNVWWVEDDLYGETILMVGSFHDDQTGAVEGAVIGSSVDNTCAHDIIASLREYLKSEGSSEYQDGRSIVRDNEFVMIYRYDNVRGIVDRLEQISYNRQIIYDCQLDLPRRIGYVSTDFS